MNPSRVEIATKLVELALRTAAHTKEQDAKALAWIKKEFGANSGQVKGALKIGPANWIKREYGANSGQYKRHTKTS